MNNTKANRIWGVAFLIFFSLQLFGSGCRGPEKAEIATGQTMESVALDSSAARTAGIRVVPAELRDFSNSIQVPGEVVFDPRYMHHLTARLPGRFERVSAFEGDRLTAGQELAWLSSPEFTACQLEFQQAFRAEHGSLAESEKIHQAGENRLRRIGFLDSEIARLRAGSTPLDMMTIRAPSSGQVIKSLVIAGRQVEAGEELYQIADPRHLWVLAAFREGDLPNLKNGMDADILSPIWPSDRLTGKLLNLDAALNTATRTLTGRIQLTQNNVRLRPGMFVQVKIHPAATGPVLTVPEQAVRTLDKRTVVFVLKEGRYHKILVTIGRTQEGWTHITQGLEAGDEVVSDGSFMLKSEFLKSTMAEEE